MDAKIRHLPDGDLYETENLQQEYLSEAAGFLERFSRPIQAIG